MKTTLATTVALALALAAQAEFKVDRAAMSEKYWSIWNDEVQAKIDADIERNRKADATFEVAAPDGAEVKVEQIGHAFRFGAHIFNYDQLGKKEWNDAYKASYGEGGIFNQATVAFYWREYEPVPGRFRAFGDYEDTARFWNSLSRAEAMEHPYWRRPAPAPAVNYLRSRGVAIHGHILIWGSAKPNWIYDWYCPEGEKRAFDAIGIPRSDTKDFPKTDNWDGGYNKYWRACWSRAYPSVSEAEIAAMAPVFVRRMPEIFRKRVFDVARDFGEVVDSWDVVNESSVDWRTYRKSRTGLPVWKSGYGLMPGDYPLHALLDAKEAFPAKANLAINDYNISPDFLAQVKDLDDEGAKIDIVGCQNDLLFLGGNPGDAEVHPQERGEQGGDQFRSAAVLERPYVRFRDQTGDDGGCRGLYDGDAHRFPCLPEIRPCAGCRYRGIPRGDERSADGLRRLSGEHTGVHARDDRPPYGDLSGPGRLRAGL